MEMKETNAGNNSGKREGGAQEQGESSAKRLKCSIEADAFCCDICSKPFKSLIFQCTQGHLCCSPCRNKLPAKDKCTHGSGCAATLARSLGMERAVQSILVDCRHAEYGCTEKIAYCNKREQQEHELSCPHEPWRCPESSCGFTVKRAAELLEHFTGHHKWPSMTFRYWVRFDVGIVEPGTHVLECKDDGQLFLLSVQPAEPAGFFVSLVSVQSIYDKAIGCSVFFSCSSFHRSTLTQDGLWPWWRHGWPPTEHICFVPKISDGSNKDAGVVLTINIIAVHGNDDDSDDSSFKYDYDDEDDDDDSS